MYGKRKKIIKLIELYTTFESKLATKDFENEAFLFKLLALK